MSEPHPRPAAFQNRTLEFRVLAAIALLCFIDAMVRLAIFDSLSFDEATQFFLAQNLAFGYPDDPPLYTWLLFLMFRVFGRNPVALITLKSTLLVIFYVFFFGSARLILGGAKLAALATLSLVCVIPVAWESYDNLTHSVLALCLSGATLYVICRILKEPTTWRYVLLGALLGFGALSKYNYVVFAGAALVALLVNRHTRAAVLESRTFLTALIAVTIAAPHAYWMLNDGFGFLAPVVKFSAKAEHYSARGVWSLGWAMLMFVTPLWILYAVLFPGGYLPKQRLRLAGPATFDCGIYLAALTIILVTLVVVFGVTTIKVRWLQPLLFLFPIYFFAYLRESEIRDKQWRYFRAVIGVAAVLLVTTHALDNFIPLVTRRYVHADYPFADLAEELRRRGLGPGIIVTDSPQMAGNLSYRFPENLIIVPRVNEKRWVDSPDCSHPLFLVWNADSQRVPATLQDFLNRRFPQEAKSLPVVFKKIPDRRFSGRHVSAGIFTIPNACL